MTDPLTLSGRRPLGSNLPPVAPLGWGMWRFKGNDLAQADRLVRTALDAGFTLFDTADIYGFDGHEHFGAAEALLGRVLQADAKLRSQFVLSSKGGIVPGIPYDSSATYLTSACEASLRRLGTDTIDLYQIHRPDLLTHPQETAEALSKLRAAGKIREVGVSNYTASQTTALQAYLSFPLASHQPEFSALHIEPLSDGVLDQALERHMAVLAWSPLGGGRLGTDATDARTRAVQAALDVVAHREDVPRTAVAYAWVLAHPAQPVALVGTQDPGRMREAIRALSVRLTREDWYAVLSASRQEPLP